MNELVEEKGKGENMAFLIAILLLLNPPVGIAIFVMYALGGSGKN